MIMSNKIDLTVIIPVVEMDDNGVALFNRALGSVNDYCDVLVVGSKMALDKLPKSDKYSFLENFGDTCYPAQVNLAVKNITTKWFTVLEFDDEFSDVWFSNVEAYIASDVDDTFFYMPLTEIVDAKNGSTVTYANEAFWASSFSEEIGCVDSESLNNYLTFNPSGSVIKTETFLSLGALKPSMKVSFWYEFLLRALYKSKRVYVIPKVGYYHKINRYGSMTEDIMENMEDKEVEWWIELAKKEYFFPNDRGKTYETEMVG